MGKSLGGERVALRFEGPYPQSAHALSTLFFSFFLLCDAEEDPAPASASPC